MYQLRFTNITDDGPDGDGLDAGPLGSLKLDFDIKDSLFPAFPLHSTMVRLHYRPRNGRSFEEADCFLFFFSFPILCAAYAASPSFLWACESRLGSALFLSSVLLPPRFYTEFYIIY